MKPLACGKCGSYKRDDGSYYCRPLPPGGSSTGRPKDVRVAPRPILIDPLVDLTRELIHLGVTPDRAADAASRFLQGT